MDSSDGAANLQPATFEAFVNRSRQPQQLGVQGCCEDLNVDNGTVRSLKLKEGVRTHLPGGTPAAQFDALGHSLCLSYGAHLDVSGSDEDQEITVRITTSRSSGTPRDYSSEDVFDGKPESMEDATVPFKFASRLQAQEASAPSTHGLSHVGKRSATSSACTNQSQPASSKGSLLLSVIPEDVLTNALAFIDVRDVPKVSTVCKALARMCECENVWREFCRREHGPDLPRLLEVYDTYVHTGDAHLWRRTYKALRSYQIEIQFFTGPREGEMEKVQVDKECMIGRSRKNNICILQDEMVSRTHAKLIMRDCKFHIVDLGSINGTCINNVPITPHEERRLRIHDDVEMGNSTFRVEVSCPTTGEQVPTSEERDEGDNEPDADAESQT